MITPDHASARVRLPLRVVMAVIFAVGLLFALPGPAVADAETPTPTPAESATQELEPTATVTQELTATATQEPTVTKTPKPTSTPTPPATPTPLPGQDLAVSFFNNSCEVGGPLLVTIFNTSATPLVDRTLRLRLVGESGLLEEHDHLIGLPAFGTANLPLLNKAVPPWVRIEIELISGVADPNANNDTASCGVMAPPVEESTQQPPPFENPDLSPGTSSLSAPPPASGIGSNSVWRPAVPTPTAVPLVVQPTLAPPAGRVIANDPQPALTPISDAGGGIAAAPQGAFPSRTLLMFGVVLLAAGTSWAFYYLTRPPRNA